MAEGSHDSLDCKAVSRQGRALTIEHGSLITSLSVRRGSPDPAGVPALCSARVSDPAGVPDRRSPARPEGLGEREEFSRQSTLRRQETYRSGTRAGSGDPRPTSRHSGGVRRPSPNNVRASHDHRTDQYHDARFDFPTSPNEAHPASPKVRSISAIRLASTSCTPCSPPTARPYA